MNTPHPPIEGGAPNHGTGQGGAPARKPGQVVRKKNKYDMAMGGQQYGNHVPGIAPAETTFSIDQMAPPVSSGYGTQPGTGYGQPAPGTPAYPAPGSYQSAPGYPPAQPAAPQFPGVAPQQQTFTMPGQPPQAEWSAPPIADSFASVRGTVKSKGAQKSVGAGNGQTLQPNAAVTAGPVAANTAPSALPHGAPGNPALTGMGVSGVSAPQSFGAATSFSVVDDPLPTKWETLRESKPKMILAGLLALSLVVGLVVGFNFLFGPKVEDHQNYKDMVALLEQGAAAQESFHQANQRYATWERELVEYGVPELRVYDMTVLSATNSTFCLRGKAYIDSKEYSIYMGISGKASQQSCR